MYLLKLEIEDQSYRHIVARVEWPRLSAAQAEGRQGSLFLDYFSQVSPLWLQLPVLSASLRIDVSADRAPVTWHGFTAAAGDAEILRQAVAALMRLDGVEGGTVAAPGDLADFEQLYAGAATGWFTLDTSPLTTSVGGEIFAARRIFDNLTTLLSSAIALGHQFSYQATLRPERPDPELLRRARKATAFLEREPAIPRRLIAAQQATLQRLEGASLLAEEAVSIAPAGSLWLQGWLRDHAAASGSDQAYPARLPVQLDDDRAHAFANHLHPDLLLPPTDPAPPARYWPPLDATRLFRCDCLWPSGVRAGPTALLPLPLFLSGGRPPRPLVPADAATGDFYFVSYAHKDIDTIRPILERLSSAGTRLWIDTQIEVGEEWDTRLETMITSSAGVLVFLSPHYVQSKHCRRELKFADSLDKHILASAIEEFPRQDGLGYIFASLQYLTGSHEAIANALTKHLQARDGTRTS